MQVESTTLTGNLVRLVPLTLEHLDALCEIGFDASIWRWTPVQVHDRHGMQAFVEEALAAESAGTAVAFATTLRESGRVVGATRFMNIAPEHRRVEIGGTWIAPTWQRTRVNTEAKYLMLRHAFEVWTCLRVELKTNALNTPSRTAILRLGAVEEGTLRKHMVNADGSLRDTVYFSIVDDEWSSVKTLLEELLAESGA